MSIIVPAGNKNVEWSPKEETMVKTASAQADVVQEEVNPLYEAAKSYIKAASDCCKECKKPNSLCECKKDEKKEDGKKEASVEDVKKETVACDTAAPAKQDAPVAKDDKSPIIEIESPIGEKAEGDAKTDIAVAVDKIEEAVVELKDAANISDAAEEAEVEIEIEDEVPEIPGKDVSQSDIIVESVPGAASACASATPEVKEAKKEDKKDEKKEEKKVEMNKSASTEEEFCKFAKLTPANRKKLSDYWVNMLGFPKDYVSLMVKDYEK